jgi:hypothetical protein
MRVQTARALRFARFAVFGAMFVGLFDKRAEFIFYFLQFF